MESQQKYGHWEKPLVQHQASEERSPCATTDLGVETSTESSRRWPQLPGEMMARRSYISTLPTNSLKHAAAHCLASPNATVQPNSTLPLRKAGPGTTLFASTARLPTRSTSTITKTMLRSSRFRFSMLLMLLSLLSTRRTVESRFRRL